MIDHVHINNTKMRYSKNDYNTEVQMIVKNCDQNGATKDI